MADSGGANQCDKVVRMTKIVMIDEQVAILKHHFKSKQLSPASTLLDPMIDNIDTVIAKPDNLIKQTTKTTSASDQLEEMDQLKHDIIQQSVITS